MFHCSQADPVPSEPAQPIERKLAAIFAADVAGYSRLMGQDEGGTMRALTAHREVMDRLIAHHRGRIANTAGDSVLAEFPSVVDAVRCAVEVQERLREENEGVPEDRQLRFRIGVHVGDVMVRGGDLLGDGVNLAARLQGLAEPSGIAISGAAHEYVRRAVPLAYADLGEHPIKNIDEPLRAFAVRVTAAPANFQTASAAKPLPLPDKPSIAVLPFTNMSGDPEQEYFADGVVEDIITALSKVKSFFVIARNSSFTYKGKSVDVRQVGRELGVQYVLEGSIRKASDRVRISGQLIEATTGRHVWAERFDADLRDVFSLQDEITARVVGAIGPRLEQAEIDRAVHKPTDNLDAYDYFLRGLAKIRAGRARETLEDAFNFFTRAIELDPQFARAYAGAAMYYVNRKDNNWMVDRAREFEEGLRLARRAVELGKQDAHALCYGGWALVHLTRRTDAGAPFIERALALNPNLTAAHAASGWLRTWNGEPEIAIERITEAIRLSPLDSELHFWQMAVAHACYHAERYREAVSWAEKATAEDPRSISALRILAASYAQVGRMEEARGAIQRVQEVDPVLRVSNLRHAVGPYRPEGLARYEEGLRLAGLSE